MAKNIMGALGGLGNMGNLVKQAQKMQKDLEEVQARVAEMTVEASSGGGAVKVVSTGKKEIKEIVISPDVVDPDDVEMLQDLVVTAVNEALRQVEQLTQAEMSKVTGGMGLPGLQ
ncbi:MAG: YbaB/EbfC family nucleoid-associated protein [Clostridiales bacterium]|jgi:DNA-binding YbaB/EbfC family protein|nr:YbaB/EbfC family nucleoid-associated protein [Clostridiales bacterium]